MPKTDGTRSALGGEHKGDRDPGDPVALGVGALARDWSRGGGCAANGTDAATAPTHRSWMLENP